MADQQRSQQDIGEDLKGLEQRFWDAMQNNDGSTASQLADDTCIVVGPAGIGALDRQQLGEMLTSARWELTHYEIDDQVFQVRKLTDDVALVAYRVRQDVVVDDKPESLEAFDTTVWVRRGDNWQCALHTETLKGDPFGRHDIDRLTTGQPEQRSGAV